MNLSADYFNVYFESVSTRDDSVPCVYHTGNSPGIKNVNLSEEGIFRLLYKLDTKKGS